MTSNHAIPSRAASSTDAPVACHVVGVHQLPQEVLVSIFNQLSIPQLLTARCVCRRWRTIADTNSSLWAHLRLQSCQSRVTDEVLLWLLHRAQFSLRSFELASMRVSDDGIKQFLAEAKLLNHLSEIDLRSCSRISDVGICLLIEAAPNLRHFSTGELAHTGPIRISDAVVRSLSLRPSMSHIHITGANRLTGQYLENFSRLESFAIPMCKGIDRHSIEQMLAKNPRLRALNVSMCSGFADSTLDALAMYCPQLESLISPWCALLTDVGISTLLKCCTQLRVLDLSGCDQIGNHTVRAIAEYCLFLEDLKIGNTAATGANLQLLNKCVDLKRLFAQKLTELTDESVTSIARSCTRLQQVNFNHCILLTVDGIDQLLASCPQLRKLDLAHCSGLTNNIFAIFEKHSSRQFVTIDVKFPSLDPLKREEFATKHPTVNLW